MPSGWSVDERCASQVDGVLHLSCLRIETCNRMSGSAHRVRPWRLRLCVCRVGRRRGRQKLSVGSVDFLRFSCSFLQRLKLLDPQSHLIRFNPPSSLEAYEEGRFEAVDLLHGDFEHLSPCRLTEIWTFLFDCHANRSAPSARAPQSHSNRDTHICDRASAPVENGRMDQPQRVSLQSMSF